MLPHTDFDSLSFILFFGVLTPKNPNMQKCCFSLHHTFEQQKMGITTVIIITPVMIMVIIVVGGVIFLLLLFLYIIV